ncbi:hypothetical protein ACOMHN_000884 [Nucella lapillus]
MAHFQLDKVLTDVTRLDGPLGNAPQARWQRKAQETLIRIQASDHGVSSPMKLTNFTSRTPGKNCKTPTQGKSPGRNTTTPGNLKSGVKESKTPKTTPGKHLTDMINRATPGKSLGGKTASKKLTLTPGRQQDRFIPNRMTTNQDMSHFALMHQCQQQKERGEEEGGDTGLGANCQYQQQLSEAMLPKQAQNGAKILSFKSVCSVQAQPNNLNVLYTTGKVPTAKPASSRHIPPRPENVLDAPVVLDDYYLHTLDWSSGNVIAAALGSEVYLWNATTSTITQLMTAADGDYVSCVCWITDGSILGVGMSDGAVQLWDVNRGKLVRTMSGHSARVGSLDWNSHILTSGSRSGSIHHHDVRVASHQVATLTHHSQEVCGLKWSPDGAYLASGGNDNTVHIWDTALGLGVAPLHTFTQHQAAVKAVSWCPWQSRLLATGGGTSDRHIRFWNTNTGACVKAVDAKSQVCSVLWSKEHRELVSGHGYSMNQLALWKYPAMSKVTDLIGHSGRILNLCMSPDGQTVASIAADETIRLWKCFAQDKTKKASKPSTTTAGPTSGLSMCIR